MDPAAALCCNLQVIADLSDWLIERFFAHSFNNLRAMALLIV
jgi:hypothetical protein